MCYFCQDCQDIWAINGPKIPKSGYFAFLLSKCQDDVRIFQKFQSTLPVLFHFDTLSSSWNLNWKVHLRSNTGIWVMQISKFSPTMVVHEGWWSGDLIWVNYSGLPLWLESLERLEIHIVLRDFSDVAGFWYIFYPHNPDFFLSGEDLKCSFTHLRTSHFKIFSDHGGGQRLFFGHIWGIFLQFLECFKCNFSHFRTSNFKIFSNHGRGQRLVFGRIFRIFLQFVEENFKCNFSYLGTSLFKIFPTMVEDNNQCFWWYGLLQQSFSHLNPHSLALVAFQKKCLFVYLDWGWKGWKTITFFWTI